MTAEPSTAQVPSSVEKAVDLLFYLHRSWAAGRREGVTAMGEALGIPKSSVHRLLAALGRRGLVERDERGGYQPGVALIALGLGVLEHEPVVEAARPVLEEAARELGETFFLVGARAGELLVLDKAEGTGFLRASPRVGSRVPVHATAVGKLYLAFAPDQVAVPEGGAQRFTPSTLGSPAALRGVVAEAAARGWAANRDEWIQGLSVLAAPVRSAGRMHGAVALAAASPRLEELGGEALAGRVIEAAAKIERRLGGAGPDAGGETR